MQKYFLDTLYDNGYLNGKGNNIHLFFERCDKLVCKYAFDCIKKI